MEQNSVKTAPHPPSAFMPRKCACAPGRSAPGPAQCEVCQNRLRSFLGPILIGSNNTSCFGSRDIFYSFMSSPVVEPQQPRPRLIFVRHAPPLHAPLYNVRGAPAPLGGGEIL